MEEFVKKSGAQIIENKGATFYAVAMAVCQLCKRVLSDVDSALTVSTMMHGEYGLEDVCLSVLCLVGRGGIEGTMEIPLTDEEMKKLHISAEKLKSVIAQVEI
jgi:L-lactate dehydrogenase